MELDFNKYCLVDGSPTTVLPPPQHHRLKAANRKSSGDPECRNDILSFKEDFLEINFSPYPKDVHSQRVAVEVVKREKIELSRESVSGLSYGIIDSLCSSDEDISLVEEEYTSSVIMSLSKQSKTSVCSSTIEEAASVSRSISPKPFRVRKMFDPLVKSNSQRSPLSNSKRSSCQTISGPTICKSLLNAIAEEKENCCSVPQYSPAHLHGFLRMGNKHGAPFFEFSVKSTDELYIAKTWKVGNGLNWIYTFHSLHHARKNNPSGWGFRDSIRESSIVGQMHVSSRMCQEFKGFGEFNDSMVTEFVSYDIVHSRKSASGPLGAGELGPELEIAAIVMEFPVEKRESLKFKSGDEKIDLCQLGKANEGISDISHTGKMHVVIPSGSHSSPIAESKSGPSAILDRWRSGGGCDCGGWDMGCPVNVLTNGNVNISPGQNLTDNQNTAQLFLQGKKDDIPALSARVIEDGKYAVDFHAQLSSLQAFSICVAILHAAEATTVVGQERSKQILRSDSTRVFAEAEIKSLANEIKEEEKSKDNKKLEKVLPSFILNPPFSPVARV